VVDVEHSKIRHDGVHAFRACDWQITLLLDLGLSVLVDMGLNDHNFRLCRVRDEVLLGISTAQSCAEELETYHCPAHSLHHLSWNHEVCNVTILTTFKCLRKSVFRFPRLAG